MKHRFICLAGVLAGCLGMSANVWATHFRFGTITWKQSPNDPLTVEVTVTEAWRHSFVGTGELYYSFGDGSFFTTSGATQVAVLTDLAGEEYSVWRYTTTHTYPSFGQYVISGESCCRISSLVNAGDASEKLTAIVDLVASNTGSPVATVPVILQMTANANNSLQLAIADPDGDPFTVRMATFNESYIPTVATVGSNVLSVSPAGRLTWNTTGAQEGQKFAVQVVIEEHHPNTGFEVSGQTVLDFIIEIVGTSQNQPPTCTGNSGPFVIPVGQAFTATFTATDPEGANLRVNHQGLPPGATLTPQDGSTAASPMTVTFSWTPAQSDANTSHAVLLTFTDPQGLQAVCPFAITVTTKPFIYISDAAVTEGDSGTVNMVFELTLSEPSSQTVSVNYATTNVTATDGADYTSATGVVSFAAGQTTQVIHVPVIGDTVYEINETFFVNLSGPVNAFLGNSRATGTIVDNDAAPSVATLPVISSVTDVSVVEGNSGATNAVFTVLLSCPSPQIVSVRYATANSGATAGNDYVATSGVLIFPPGETMQTVTVVVSGDTLNEADETFFLNLSNPTNVIIGDSRGVGTILNDDPVTTQVSIGNVTVMESHAGATNAVFQVTLSQPSGQTVSVKFATADGTATAGSDYAAKAGTVSFPAGTTSKTVSITVNNDALSEPDETFLVVLSQPANASIAAGGGQGTGTILNNPFPAVTINDVSVTEGNEGTTHAIFEVRLSAPGTDTVTVQYATTNGTATTAGNDYLSSSGTLVFEPGTTSQEIIVEVNGDLLNEADETFFVNLSNPAFAVLMDTQGKGTIVNDDNVTVSVSIDSIFIHEPNAGTTNANFTVMLSQPSGQTVSVKFATADGTATAGSDYVGRASAVVFSPGVTSRTVSVAVKGDTTQENDETFFVNLSAPVNATIGAGQGVGTIINATAQNTTPALLIADASVSEGDSGTTNLVFNVTMPFPSAQTVTVNYATANGTATAGVDYAAASGVLTFPPGTTTQSVSVAVVGDLINESNETLTVTLNSPVNATLLRSKATGSILNDDPLPAITIHDANLFEGHIGTRLMEFELLLSRTSSRNVTVSFSTLDGSALAPGSYATNSGVLVFPAGTLTQCVAITIHGNTVIEPDKTFKVRLSSPVNATLANQDGIGTILNDDGLPGDLDHFVFSHIQSPQYVNEPFALAITAKDRFGGPAVNFNGNAQITGLAQALGGAFNLLGGVAHQNTQNANVTGGYAFTPSSSLLVTHVRHYSGTKVSIWTDTGNLLASATVSGTPGTWRETPLATPVLLTAGSVYRVSILTGGTYFYRTSGATTFSHGSLGPNYVTVGDAFPNQAFPFRLQVDLRYSVLMGSQALDFIPQLATPFVNGVWTGNLTVRQTADMATLRVDDGMGHTGQSVGFPVLAGADPLQLTSGSASGGNIQLFFTPGQGYIIEASSDLIHWTPVFTNLTGSASAFFSDPIGAGNLFYRAVLLP